MNHEFQGQRKPTLEQRPGNEMRGTTSLSFHFSSLLNFQFLHFIFFLCQCPWAPAVPFLALLVNAKHPATLLHWVCFVSYHPSLLLSPAHLSCWDLYPCKYCQESTILKHTNKRKTASFPNYFYFSLSWLLCYHRLTALSIKQFSFFNRLIVLKPSFSSYVIWYVNQIWR